MDILNQFKRNVEWNKKEKSRDKLKKEIKELNIASDTAASKVYTEWYEDYDGSDTHTTHGPFQDEYTDGKVIMPALEGNMLGAYTGAISWLNYMGDDAVDRFNKWYEKEQTNFITKICLQGIDTVNILAEELARYEEKLGTRAIAVIPPEYGKHKQIIKKFFYQCIAIGILNGSIPDKYNLAKEVYNQEHCRNLLNEFPLHGDAKSVDGRSLNIAVAFWIAYIADSSLHGVAKTYSNNAELSYKYLIDYLGYKDIKVLNINETQQYSGIDQRFFDSRLDSTIKDMCNNNKAATKFIHMLRYIYINNVDNGFTQVSEVSTSVSKEKTRDGHKVSYSEQFGTFEFKLSKKEYNIVKIK